MNVKEFEKLLQDKIKQNSRKNKDSGKLEKSIKVTVNPNTLEINVEMLEYGLYQKSDLIEKAIEEVITENNIYDILTDGIDNEI